jgi:hypothetical protein
MKKIFLAITIVAVSVVSAQAQTTSFGLKGGITAANIKESVGSLNISLDSKIGFYAGAFADISVSDNIGIQPELFYSLLGAKAKATGGEGGGKLDLGYISLPVLVKYKNQGFSVFLGPQISYLLSAKSSDDGSSSSEDIKDELKSTEIAGVIGAGYTLTNGFGFDARYQLGLSNISKNSDDDVDATIKNNAFLVGVHYFFNR